MTHTFRRLVLSVLFTGASFISLTANAADEPAKKDRGPGEGSEFGVLGNFMTADPVLGFLYDKSQAVNGVTVGGYYTSRQARGFRVTGDLTYTTVSPKDGPWLAAGKTPDQAEWTEFRQGGSRGFSVVSADVILGHEFGQNGTFGFYIGGGIGLAFPLGTVTSYGIVGGQKDPTSVPDKKKVPPVAPTVLFKIGPTVNIGTKGTLMPYAGFQDGLMVGLSLGYRM